MTFGDYSDDIVAVYNLLTEMKQHIGQNNEALSCQLQRVSNQQAHISQYHKKNKIKFQS